MEIGGQEEAIAQYLTQQMTDVERSAFEQKISESPQLTQKIKFEKQIAEGIKNYKQGLLKSRLNQLEVGSSVGETTSITTKIALSSMAVITVGFLSYFLLTPDETLVIENQELHIGADVIAKDKNSDISLKMDTTNEALSDKKQDTINSEITKDIENTSVNTSVKVSIKQSKFDKEPLRSEVEVVLPDMDGSEISFDDPIESRQDFPDDLVIDQARINLNSELMVEMEMKKSKKLKYILSGEKLILIGDFSASPYQIIEDNTMAKKKLFLYFEQEYYALTFTSEKKALIPVRDIRLLDYLIELRNK
jgi:hypothetical protein|tara:strand:+ start:37 stop:954 length:918 start_codon:yes stop_codon:yes gene_type:complete